LVVGTEVGTTETAPVHTGVGAGMITDATVEVVAAQIDGAGR